MKTCLPALVLVCWGVALAAQQPPTFRAGIDLLAVDVTVIDDRGRPVPDLLAPEFTVKVDGEPRRIVTAEFVSEATPVAERDPLPPTSFYSTNESARYGRLLLLVVDQGNIRTGAARAVMAGARRFLDGLSPTDRVALVSIPQPGPRVGFTTNHRLVREQLGNIVGLAHRERGRHNLGISEAFTLAQASDALTREQIMVRECRTFSSSANEFERCERDVDEEARDIVLEVRTQTQASIQGLRDVLLAMRDIEGAKSLLLISEGLVLEGLGSELSGIASLAAAGRVSVNVMLLDVPRFDATQSQLPPTPTADRDLQVQGLDLLAGMTRGATFRVYGSSDAVFERITLELSGYYLLGVETTPPDRDGKRHQIRVEVRRRGVTVRARREFSVAARTAASMTDEEIVLRALRAPLPVAELPIRVTSYAYQDPSTAKVRVLVAAEIDSARTAAADVTVGFALLDGDGRAIAHGIERKTLTPVDTQSPAPLGYAGAMLVEPGRYTLKLAVVDGKGRRGSVEHAVQAWQMAEQDLAVGDLMLANAVETSGGTIRPGVETRLNSDQLAAYLELYSTSPDALQNAKVTLEVADQESGPVLASAPAALGSTGSPQGRVVRAIVPLGALPPGRYVARAIITMAGRNVGTLARPFHIPPGARARAGASAGAMAEAAAPAMAVSFTPSRFQREQATAPEVMGAFFEALDRARPSFAASPAKSAIARARAGRLEGTARRAFEAGDQLAAAYLGGLEFLAKNSLDQAANQFQVALRIAPDFFPGSFYLGVCYAAAGRDREAVTAWRRSVAANGRVAITYRLLADALFRLGQGTLAVDPLTQAAAQWPDDEQIRRGLGFASLMAGRHAGALAALEPYLERHESDHEALLAAMQALYAAHAAGRTLGSPDDDRARITRYARAYAAANGPQQSLVAKWVEFISRTQSGR